MLTMGLGEIMMVLAAVGWVVCLLYWAASICSMIQLMRNTPALEDQPVAIEEDEGNLPKLSVIIAACDEERDIESAARTLLAQDYPNLQLVIVDDRSTDRTGGIIDRLAADDARIVPVHIRELPDGWMGKVHALQRGLEAADGQWVLFTDADVHFGPGTLSKAIGYAQQRQLDHLAVLPQLWPSGLLVTSMIITFIRILVLSMRLWKVNDPASRSFMGVGAFNLVLRESLGRTPGLEWIRLDVADDMALGMMLRQNGARQGLVNGRHLMGLHWYRTVGQMNRGCERGYASVANCNWLRAIVSALLLAVLELSLPAMILWPLFEPFRWIALGFFAAFLFASFLQSRWSATPFLPVLLFQVSAFVMAVMGIRGGILGGIRKGIYWRGKFYPRELLRNAARLRL